MKGEIKDNIYNLKEINKNKYHNGLFLYEVGIAEITLNKSFLFADKDYTKCSEDSIKQLLEPYEHIGGEYVEPELDEIEAGEYEYLQLDYNHQQKGQYNNAINFKETDEEHVDELRILREKKKQDALKAQKNNNKSVFMLTMDRSEDDEEEILARLNTEEREERKQKQEEDLKKLGLIDNEEFKEITRLKDVIEKYPLFDIPYLEITEQQSTFMKGQYDNIRIKEQPNEEKQLSDFQKMIKQLQQRHQQSPIKGRETFSPNISPSKSQGKPDEAKAEDQPAGEPEEEEKPTAFKNDIEAMLDFAPFSKEEYEKINDLHTNMHLQLTTDGDIFLINRLNNRLYHFHKNQHGAYELTNKKFPSDFAIQYADSSDGNIVVWNKERYQVFSRFDDLMFDSKDYEQKGVNKDIVGPDAYSYTIKQIAKYGEKLIMRIKDEDTEYVKVFDYRLKSIVYYIECGPNTIISGCKRYIWLTEQNQVYDLENGLATFFIWASGQTTSHYGYGYHDNFMISEDKTIMVTSGYLQLAFDMISYRIDKSLFEALNTKGEAYSANEPYFKIPNLFPYLCYKICDYRSVLEHIFEKDYDKLAIEQFEKPAEAEDNNEEDGEASEVKKVENNKVEDPKVIESKKQNQFHKIIQSFLNFLTASYNPEKNDPQQISMFFLSYYFVHRKGNEKIGSQVYLNFFQKMYSHQDKRIDLIEDILQYVVNANLPITQNVVASCFTDFLENANSSKAFRQYLENITLQTTKMTEIDSFQILSNDNGFISAAHDSPILDDRFYTNTRQMRESKKDVEIRYINLGNLMCAQGEAIMDMLSDKKYLGLMDIPFIKYFVMYQYQNVKKKIQRKLLYPFCALLALYTIYAVYFVEYSDLAENHTSSTFKIIFNYANVILLSTALMYFLIIEIRQLVRDPADYFSFWNLSDLTSYLLCLMVIAFDMFSASKNVLRPTAAICLIILWIRMFYFLRVFESTARLIRMIIEIVNDMKNFLIVLFIGILGFTGGLYILQQGLTTDESGATEMNLFVGQDYFQSFIYTYRMALGDFQLDNFNDYLNQGLTFEYYLIWILFMFGSMFLVIVLLNLLIAIMGDTFGRVLESIQNMVIREKVLLISENEALFDRTQLFGNAQFLIIITEKQLEGDAAENWDGPATLTQLLF